MESGFYPKRGYLREDFLFFHLRDQKGESYEYHYHDFYKMIFFLEGQVSYLLEGRTYRLEPGDILFVTDRDVHRAVIDTHVPYERMVLWFNPRFLPMNAESGFSYTECFDMASAKKQNLLRPSQEDDRLIRRLLGDMKTAFQTTVPGSKTEKNALFMLLMVRINRIFQKEGATFAEPNGQYDETIQKVIDYIERNLQGELSIDTLSSQFYISRYTLMHKFKRETGFTLHYFILQKRLLLAASRLKNGASITDTSYACGFTDYSVFMRAFKRFYGVAPREYVKQYGE